MASVALLHDTTRRDSGNDMLCQGSAYPGKTELDPGLTSRYFRTQMLNNGQSMVRYCAPIHFATTGGSSLSSNELEQKVIDPRARAVLSAPVAREGRPPPHRTLISEGTMRRAQTDPTSATLKGFRFRFKKFSHPDQFV
ncbi:hypothetical protein EVAR_36007_1 [Eumeta japonica]|uniref:Uncharacterized protein n=1 Tax=Eumeta variegata TaxID=151549 RepID=A0A4C1WUA2_EUMVA|nr:hypothetical protein EVAR_36007_1 [Eumeta japonica]